MNVLIVGAGAVGQVYGHHLQQGGAALTFYVRERYRADAARGFTVYPLNRRDPSMPVRFDGFDVVSTLDEVRAGRWDQVWLAVSSPALRAGWLGPLLQAAGSAVVVGLTPGVDDRDLLLQHVPADRLVQGMISLISYQAPLPGETRFAAPGMAWWFPPLAPSPFSGPDAPVAAIVDTLSRGGQPATRATDLSKQASFGSAMLMPHLLALEAAGWSWADLKAGDGLRLAADGAKEAFAAVSAHLGVPAPAARHAVRPWVLKLLLGAAPWVVPLDLETYLAYHFTKVGDQTRMYVKRYRELAAAHGLPSPALDALDQAVPAEVPDAHDVAERVAARVRATPRCAPLPG